MDGARHERRVLDHVGEDDELGSAHGVGVGGEAGGILDGVRDREDGVHVDAGAQARDVDARADAARLGERAGNARYEAAVAVADALVDERREAAEIVDAEGLGGAVERMGERRQVLVGARGGDLRDGRDRDALVDDRDAVLALEVARGLDEALGGRGDAVVHLGRHAREVLVGTAHEGDAHGDGADIEVLLRDHAACLSDLSGRNRHSSAPFQVDASFVLGYCTVLSAMRAASAASFA